MVDIHLFISYYLSSETDKERKGKAVKKRKRLDYFALVMLIHRIP